MVHLTHTGYYAGTVYCGADRIEKDEYVHMNLKYIEKHRGDICEKCLSIFDNCSVCEKDDCEDCCCL